MSQTCRNCNHCEESKKPQYEGHCKKAGVYFNGLDMGVCQFWQQRSDKKPQ